MKGGGAFGAVRSRLGGRSKPDDFARTKHVIYELSPDVQEWDAATRELVYLVMQEIAADLSRPSSERKSLALLYTILTRGGKQAAEMGRPIFYEKVRAMYAEPCHKTEPFLPRVLLILAGYDAHEVENVTREAIHCWGDEQFRAARGFLSASELERNGLRGAIKSYLSGEIAQAGNHLDRTALNRALELYLQVK